MNDELKNMYITTIYNTVSIVFDYYYGLEDENIKTKINGIEHLICSINGDNVRVSPFPYIESDTKLVLLNELDGDALVLINQHINYNVITSTSSIIKPIVNEEDGTHAFELYEIYFDLGFDVYLISDELEVGDLIETFDDYNEALMQQRNMLN